MKGDLFPVLLFNPKFMFRKFYSKKVGSCPDVLHNRLFTFEGTFYVREPLKSVRDQTKTFKCSP